MSLQNNNAIILFGATNSKNLTVSPDLGNIGIQLLRASPTELKLIGIPDHNQPNYGFYKSNLSVYLKSYVENTAVDATLSGYPTKIPLGRCLPLIPPKLIMGWRAPVAEEVKQDIMTKHGGVPVMSTGGKPGLEVQKETLLEYAGLQEYRPDPIFPTIENSFNFNCFIPMLLSIRLISALLLLHHYPAWEDVDHMVECLKGEAALSPASKDGDIEMAPTKGKGIFAKGIKYKFDDETHLCYTTPEDIPNTHGLFCAYIGKLAKWDKDAVPEFLHDHVLLSLGEDDTDIRDALRDLRGAWGVLNKTEWGMELAHIATCFRLALVCQARCIPIIENKKYTGCVISGAGFTIQTNNKVYTPVDYDTLLKAVKGAQLHDVAIKKVIDMVQTTNEVKLAMYGRIKSMARLQTELQNSGVREIDMIELMKYARLLTFPGEKSWSINVNTLTKAFDTIANPEMSLEGYPIHPNLLFSTKRSHVVWSCFGAMAPSFRIPGGRSLDLSKELKVTVSSNVRGRKTEQKQVAFSKVACRNLPLDRALRDLDLVITEQTILSPFAQANIRRSTANMDRFFQGDQGIQVIAGLRKLCGISEISTTGKRRAEAEIRDDVRPSKRAFLDAF